MSQLLNYTKNWQKSKNIEKLFLAQNCLKRIMRIVIVTCFEGHILLWSQDSPRNCFQLHDVNIMYLSTIILLFWRLPNCQTSRNQISGINCWKINCRPPGCTTRAYNVFVFASCGSDNFLYSQCKLTYYCTILHCEKNLKKNGKTAKFLTELTKSVFVLSYASPKFGTKSEHFKVKLSAPTFVPRVGDQWAMGGIWQDKKPDLTPSITDKQVRR